MITATRDTQRRVEKVVSGLGVIPRKGEAVVAYINLGRWVADCACNGGELVTPGEIMLCGSCGRTHTVTFPGPKTKAKIEAVLGRRDPVFQNWLIGETVDELEAENIENGLWEDM